MTGAITERQPISNVFIAIPPDVDTAIVEKKFTSKAGHCGVIARLCEAL